MFFQRSKLQWGRARPHAEMRRFAPPLPSHLSLQWGRARPHAEIFCPRTLRHRIVRASMGPRASARGNEATVVQARKFFMELQWGRARPHAEMRRSRSSPADPSGRFNGAARVRTRKFLGVPPVRRRHRELQWGRARPHAEIGLHGRPARPGGTASMGPRASARGNSLLETPIASAMHASMGPRASARGNQRRGLEHRCSPARFNGAARVRTRKSSRPSRSPAPGRCFNGAARVRTRKCERLAPDDSLDHHASMGPRASARGNLANERKTHEEALELQWGRARPHAEIGARGIEQNSESIASMGPRASARGNRAR